MRAASGAMPRAVATSSIPTSAAGVVWVCMPWGLQRVVGWPGRIPPPSHPYMGHAAGDIEFLEKFSDGRRFDNVKGHPKIVLTLRVNAGPNARAIRGRGYPGGGLQRESL